MLKLLIKQGACTEPLTPRTKWTPLMIACFHGRVKVAKYLLRLKQTITEDSLGKGTIDLTLKVKHQSSKLKLCALLLPRGFDLHRVHINGFCPIFDVMTCSRHWVLRHLLRDYPLSLRIEDIQWSSSVIQHTWTSNRLLLANITRGYCLVHRYLGREEPLVVSESVAVAKSSLLYLAASKGRVAAVDDPFSIGIDMEGEISEEGTAITVAAAHGQLDVVKYLARQGAKMILETSGPQDGASVAAHGKKEVLQ
ncbi:hypothetical protein F4782DRAFT_547347 [Xylaria castorea]|nr:hypothetical protein F4782DRAFT_547347 [Xylaria castorea]